MTRIEKGLAGEILAPEVEEPQGVSDDRKLDAKMNYGGPVRGHNERGSARDNGEATATDGEWEDKDDYLRSQRADYALEENGDEIGELGPRHNAVSTNAKEPDLDTTRPGGEEPHGAGEAPPIPVKKRKVEGAGADKEARKKAKKEKKKAEKREKEEGRKRKAQAEAVNET